MNRAYLHEIEVRATDDTSGISALRRAGGYLKQHSPLVTARTARRRAHIPPRAVVLTGHVDGVIEMDVYSQRQSDTREPPIKLALDIHDWVPIAEEILRVAALETHCTHGPIGRAEEVA